jgi:hypothetical protein
MREWEGVLVTSDDPAMSMTECWPESWSRNVGADKPGPVLEATGKLVWRFVKAAVY